MATFSVGQRVRVIQFPSQVGIVTEASPVIGSQPNNPPVTNYDPAYVASLVGVSWYTDGGVSNILPYPTLISSNALESA